MYDRFVDVGVLACFLPGASPYTLEPRALPDLIVEGVGWIPEHPKVGDKVLFAARIKNIGSAATPPGKICGVGFCIGQGNPRFCSDNYTEPLAPGESLVLYANGGEHGSPYWIATAGDKPAGVYANVNDSRRFQESNWLNNILVRPFSVAGRGPKPSTLSSGLPDLTITKVRFSPNHPHFGEPVRAFATVLNQSAAPTQFGASIGVGFYTDYLDTAVLTAHSDGKPLAPGCAVTLSTSAGDHLYPWIPFPGRHHIVAFVNDVGRIRESDPENNFKDTVLRVYDGRERTLTHLQTTRRVLNGIVFGDQKPAEPPWTRRDRAFDGDVDTTAISSSQEAVVYGMDLGETGRSRVHEIAFYPKPYFESRWIGGRFQASNLSAGAGYRDLFVVKKAPKLGWNFIKVSDVRRYRYVRYLAPAKSQGYVSEITFFGIHR